MVDGFSTDFLNSLNLSFDISLLYSANDSENGNGSLYTGGDGFSSADEDKYEKTLFNYYLMGIGGTTICIIGIICNILSVIVLTRRVMNSSTYSYLTSLAICDTTALFFTLIIFLLSEDTKYPVKGKLTWVQNSYAYLFPFLHPGAVTFQVTSIWLTLAFTVDRYIMICHPFKAERMCSVSRARKVIVAIFLLGLLFNIPKFLEYKFEKIEVPSLSGGMESHVIVRYTDLGKDQVFIDFVHSYLYLTFVCGIPFLTLSILNIFLIYAVHMSRKRGMQINAKEKKRNDTTVMLIGVIVIFLSCQGPALISRMVYAIDIRMATSSLTFHKINEIGNLLIIVNSAINIVPYYFFGKRFRKEFWRLFCKCFLTQQELRKIKRSLSFSIDNRRRASQCSVASQLEMNGLNPRGGDIYTNSMVHRDSNSPLLQHLHVEFRDSLHSLRVDRNPSPHSQKRMASPQPLRVVWEMDDNKNEKYNVQLREEELEEDTAQL